MRLTRKRLKEIHQDEYEQIRVRVELDLYPQVIEEWTLPTTIIDPLDPPVAPDERVRDETIG